MKPILFGFGLFYCWITLTMGDFIYCNSKEGSVLSSHQTVSRVTMPKEAL